MSFTGGPGTGTTTVALHMAEMLNRMGYLAKGHLVNVIRIETEDILASRVFDDEGDGPVASQKGSGGGKKDGG